MVEAAQTNYGVGFGNEEEEGRYSYYDMDLEALRENKYLNIKMLPKQTHNPGILSLHQTETLLGSKAKTGSDLQVDSVSPCSYLHPGEKAPGSRSTSLLSFLIHFFSGTFCSF